MPHLIPPDARFQWSFLAAMKEFSAEDEDGEALAGHELREYGATWHRPDVFASYVHRLNAERFEATPRVEGWVPNTNLWYVEGDTFLGRLSIRHRLNPFLHELGGHIGYSVRPSARRQGHATAMLAASLPFAHRLGIDPALVTCDVTNVASRKVIEAAGGAFEDQRRQKLRYWVPTAC